MTSTAVTYNFDTVQAHANMRTKCANGLLQPLGWVKQKNTTRRVSNDLLGVNSSSHNSTPIQVSYVEITASPIGTVVYVPNKSLYINIRSK